MPNLAIFNVRTMERVIADSLWQLHLYRWLIGLFASLALAARRHRTLRGDLVQRDVADA